MCCVPWREPPARVMKIVRGSRAYSVLVGRAVVFEVNRRLPRANRMRPGQPKALLSFQASGYGWFGIVAD